MQKCWPRPNASERRMGRFQMNSSGFVLPFVPVGRGEQRDDALARFDRLAVNGEGFAHSSGEPLRRSAVPDHLLSRERHVGGGVGAHRGQLVGALAELPEPVRDDLGHGFGAADEDAEHLGRGFDVVQRAAIGQPIAEQAVDNGQRVPDGPARRRSTTGVRNPR